MAAESISTYRKPGFPRYETTENGFRTVIEYIGPAATLAPAEPASGVAWGDFQGSVRGTTYSLVEGSTTQAELSVTVELAAESPDTAGTLESETFEIDWVLVGRPMEEHPAFAIGQGGAYALTSTDISDIQNWKNEEDHTLRDAYSYASKSYEWIELSSAARMFAHGIELGQENMEDFAPVARKTSTYIGGPPDESMAGQKETPVGFTRLPNGYEWRKSADRNITAGKRTRWERVEEWLGAKKVLHDKDEIFWSAP